MWEETKEWGKNLVEYSTRKLLSLLIYSYQFGSFLYHREYASFDLPLLTNTTSEALPVFFSYLCQIWPQLCFGLPTSSLHKQTASLHYSPNTYSCFHCLCFYFLPFSLTSRPHSPMPVSSLPPFLCLGIPNFCVLWKECLKICQLSSSPLFLWTVFQTVLLTNSLKIWKFAFLKTKFLPENKIPLHLLNIIPFLYYWIIQYSSLKYLTAKHRFYCWS